MTAKKIDSLKHDKAKRARIPSREEAGCEQDSAATAKAKAQFPLNPVVHRGQDPELWWMHKYGPEDAAVEGHRDLDVDIRSLYRHEHIAPEKLIQRLYDLRRQQAHQDDMFVDDLFANYKDVDELDKPAYYYKQADKWSNRLIQGDSLMVMTSLLEREGMARQVQCIYIDPPYGIKYGSNWQLKLGDKVMPNSDPDEALSGEPEVIKAFRDTWELGIHSYLSYLRDRLLAAKELLTDSGSCFVQISDENVHLVRCVMDEVFGSENFVSLITFKKTGGHTPRTLANICDYIIWYGKKKDEIKYRPLHLVEAVPPIDDSYYVFIQLPDGSHRRMTPEERARQVPLPTGAKIFRHGPLQSQGESSTPQKFMFNGEAFYPSKNRHWTISPAELEKVAAKGLIFKYGNHPYSKLFWDFNPATKLSNVWLDTQSGGFSDSGLYVVQTTTTVVQRCLLMTTDPGDLVLDPTCGSGTTAHVAETWGRRWITIDTSRIALNIAKTRLMTASYPWYILEDEKKGLPREHWDLRHGFDYKKVQRVTLSSLANDEPPEEITLYDQPYPDRKKLRVAGPFTVETLQSFEPLSPEAMDEASLDHEQLENFQARVFEHLKSAGIKNGDRNETAVFARVDALPEDTLHAEGYYDTPQGERKAYIHLGPQFAPVTKQAVNAAVKECRARGDADWLLILGFAFESDVENSTQKQKAGSFEVTKVRMHDDLLQAGLTKKDKKAATFVTIGEPDIAPVREGDSVTVEIRGLDIYDPIKDEVKPRSVADIAYWMVDDAYDGASFMVRQVFFCGGDHDEFDKWKKGLSDLAKASTKKKAEKTLKIEIDDEAFERIYGHRSHPIPYAKGKKIAVRVVSQFGEECTKVLTL